MSYFLEQPGLFDQPIRLEPGQREDPFQVMKDFFVDYRLHEWRAYLWNMVEACVSTDNDLFAEAGERASLLLHYKDLEELLEAAWLLVLRDKEGPQAASAPAPARRSRKVPAAMPAKGAGGTGGLRVANS
ncbi:MAG TPA: hypothetical protein VK563_15915 [Puia sp.]|nr:hypothetical protein [Puia sp.]